MKINNMRNLVKAINQKEPEIEIHADFSEAVIKAGLISNVLYAAVVAAVLSFSVSALLGTAYMFIPLDIFMILAIIFVSVSIFATATLLTLILTQKISLSLSLRLRKYSVNKHNNIVVLKARSNR